MKNKILLSLCVFLSLVSCAGPNTAEKTNNVVTHETGIKQVELTTLYSGDELTGLMDTINKNVENISSVNSKRFAYNINSNMTNETSTTEERKGSFFGIEKQFAVLETTTETLNTLGGAVTTRTSSSSKAEYAVGDKKKITYIKTEAVGENGKKTLKYDCNYNEAGGTNIQKKLMHIFVTSISSGTMGSSRDGKLYYVYYYESFSRVSAYNENGETVSGLTKTYNHVLFDLNTYSEPRYNAIYSANITETNVNGNGERTNDFHISSKTSYESFFHYDKLSDFEDKRTALINEYPIEIVDDLRAVYYEGGSSDYARGLTITQNPADENKNSGTMNLSSYRDYEFAYSASKRTINKQNETLAIITTEYQTMPIDNSKIILGEHPEVDVTVANSKISVNVSISVKIQFQASKNKPYLSILSIELL